MRHDDDWIKSDSGWEWVDAFNRVENIVTLDCSWYTSNFGRDTFDEYKDIHIKNAHFFDRLLKNNLNIKLVKRLSHLKEVFHLYQINVENRESLKKFLISNSVDAKVHYPKPIHLQQAAKYLKYKKGDFPMAEKMANTSLSLPVHEFIKESDIKYVANLINNIY